MFGYRITAIGITVAVMASTVAATEKPDRSLLTEQLAGRAAELLTDQTDESATSQTTESDPCSSVGSDTTAPAHLPLDELIKITKPLFEDSHRQPVRVTLRDCVRRCLSHNLDVRVGSYEPPMRMADITTAEAVFDSVLFGSSQFSITDKADIDSGFYNQTVITGAGTKDIRIPTSPFSNIHDYDYMLGLRKLLPTGASVQLAQKLRRLRDLNDQDELYRNPFYEFAMQFQLRQPLLRDFGIEVNRASILASRNNYRISRNQFQLLVIKTASEVESNYWRLFLSRRRVMIFAGLVDRAQKSLQRVRSRQTYDSLSLVVTRTLAVIKKAQANLVVSRNLVLEQQDLLLRKLNDPNLPLEGLWEIIPSDQPTRTLYKVDYAPAVYTALQSRPEIAAQRYRLDTAGLAQDVAENQRLPRLDMFYQQEMTGAGDAYRSSWDQQWTNETNDYLVGLSFEYPFGNRAAEAALTRAQYRGRQEKLQLQNVREEVVADVNISLNKLNNTFEEISVRLQAVQADRGEVLNYLAIQDTERQDSTTPQFVNLKLNADERLTYSQISAVQTLVEYNMAIMNLHRAQGTLLRYNNIEMDDLTTDYTHPK